MQDQLGKILPAGAEVASYDRGRAAMAGARAATGALRGLRAQADPVCGSSSSGGCGGAMKSNIPFNDPARASSESSPIRPVDQLSSMKRRIEVWSVWVWSTKSGRA